MKYYRVIQDNFLWQKEAILKEDNSGYSPIEDIWDTTKFNEKEYISSRIIENNPTYFERVYESSLNKFVFKTADEMRKLYAKFIN